MLQFGADLIHKNSYIIDADFQYVLQSSCLRLLLWSALHGFAVDCIYSDSCFIDKDSQRQAGLLHGSIQPTSA